MSEWPGQIGVVFSASTHVPFFQPSTNTHCNFPPCDTLHELGPIQREGVMWASAAVVKTLNMWGFEPSSR